MRIAFVSFDFGEYSIMHANALSQTDDVMLVLPHSRCQPHLDKLEDRVDLRPFHRARLRQPYRQFKTCWWICQQIKKFQPDVVHFQLGHFWFNLFLPLLRRYPLVFTIHDPRHHVGDRDSKKTPQAIMDFGYRQADRIIVHGQPLKDDVVNDLSICPETISVIPHVAIGSPTQPSARGNESENVLLFFGRIWEYKGLEYLIRAEPKIAEVIPDVKIVIAGTGENLEKYRRMMVHPERFEVHDRFISDDQRSEFFERCSIVVLPYIDASQSGVVPVAYTHAKPVIATTVGGLPESVEHERTGLLVPPKDTRALADAAIRLLRDARWRRELGANGKKKLESECSPEVVARSTAEVYRAAIRDRQGPKKVRVDTTKPLLRRSQT